MGGLLCSFVVVLFCFVVVFACWFSFYDFYSYYFCWWLVWLVRFLLVSVGVLSGGFNFCFGVF